MSFSTNSDFCDIVPPLSERLKLYDPTKPPTDQPKNDAAPDTRAIPQAFIDAMTVRHTVFVEEQGVPLENEFDEDDARSFHWTVYASVFRKNSTADEGPQDEKLDPQKRRKSTSTTMPIGTIRLTPPPHPLHPNGKQATAVQPEEETFVQLSRLAVIKEYRKAGVSQMLINNALKYIRERPTEVLPQYEVSEVEHRKYSTLEDAAEFKGLVLVHSQTGAQKVWRKYGFETDDSMGKWDEEGIEHVGMWRRLDVREGKRNAKIWFNGTKWIY